MKAELYWIDGPWQGRLAILPRPRGGDWLQDEVRSWHSEGVDVMVSLLTDEEITDLELAGEPELCKASGIEYIRFPIGDREVPTSPKATAELIRRLERKLLEGKNVAIHCRAGIGRSALVAACLLVLSGKELEAAFERIRAARGCPVPDTVEQREWVDRFARSFLAATPKD